MSQRPHARVLPAQPLLGRVLVHSKHPGRNSTRHRQANTKPAVPCPRPADPPPTPPLPNSLWFHHKMRAPTGLASGVGDSWPGSLVRLASSCEVCPFRISNEAVLVALSKSGRALEDPSPQVCRRPFSSPTCVLSMARGSVHSTRDKRLDPRSIPAPDCREQRVT